ncbi:CMRF35-like molecule 8 [Saccopteryx bilineata]|uniref:CMRF35-like molecule 8 n=1 Tax=Saccopteryx bilineata TaxID=59482 RepID=UPI00338EC01C
MTQQGPAWLPAALLLLWVPGCLSLRGPSHVMGPVGGSLSVQCRYNEEFTENKKYWYKGSYSPLVKKIVETTESQREVRHGRVSIRDHPANHTFTVTLESLTEDDEGTYGCGINLPWHEGGWDPTWKVVVTVIPATPSTPLIMLPTTITTAKTTTITAKIPTVSTTPVTVDVTCSTNSQDDFQKIQDHRQGTLVPVSWRGDGRTTRPPSTTLSPSSVPVLFSLSAVLLLLLVGTSLLAWRMVRRRIKADENSEPPQGPSQASQQSEPCYANLELPMWPLPEETVHPRQVEVEYSTVQAPREDLHYTTVAFNVQNQDSKDSMIPSQKPPQQEPEYSVIKKK